MGKTNRLYKYEDTTTNTRIRKMGFLLGAFGKLAAGRRKRDIQSQLMRVQTRLRRATKQVGIMDKQIARAEQQAKNQLKLAANSASQQALQKLQEELGISSGGSPTGEIDQNKLYEYNSKSSMITSNKDAWYATQEQMIADYFENLRDTQLEPLKQEEELLQMEQDQLNSQLQLAEADYDACKQMEKDGAKNLKPEYTAGG